MQTSQISKKDGIILIKTVVEKEYSKRSIVTHRIYHNITFFIMFLLYMLQAGEIIERTEAWNDSARVVVIWNGGAIKPVATNTRDYVLDAIQSIKNVAIYTGTTPSWPDATLETFRIDFDGKLPHVIVYINSGWLWDDLSSTKTKTPYDILKTASDSGIGIVAIGDDAAFDGQHVFPMTGPNGNGNVVNSDNTMKAAKEFDSVWVWLNLKENKYLSDGGILWNVTVDTLFFKSLSEGRGEADADRWDIDTTWLDNYSYIGYQQAWSSTEKKYTLSDGSVEKSNLVHIDSYRYKSISALQRSNQRIAMLSYQPQFMRDDDASSQIVYNSVYWASKAHEVLQIPTPEANPKGGNILPTQNISLSVNLHNSSLFELRYTLDGTEPTVTSPIYSTPIKVNGNDSLLVIKAIAFATDTVNWMSSEMMVEQYKVDWKSITLSALPEDGTHFMGDTTICILSEPSEVNIYFTIDGEDPDTTNELHRYTAPFLINKSCIVKACAISNDDTYLPTDIVSWSFIKDEPKIILKAEPGDCSFFGDTIVEISSIPDNANIYYSTDETIPDTTNESQRYTGPITISKTSTIKAIAIKKDYTVSDVYEWNYIKDEPKIILKAEPGDCSFFGDTIIEISSIPDSAVIYYTTDETTPDTTNESQRYTGPITISKTSMIKAIAIKKDYTASSVYEWNYTKTLWNTTLDATPESFTTFGKELVVSLKTNANKIYYTIDGTVPDISNEQQLYTGSFIIDQDSVEVKAIALGEDYIFIEKSFFYFRQYAPEVVILPKAEAFVESVNVTLYNSILDAEIYYTLDGSEPVKGDTVSTKIYNGEKLYFTTDTRIRARAYAPDYMPGLVSEKHYRRLSQVTHAVYTDNNGNGIIDAAIVTFDYQVNSIPKEIIFQSPFDNNQQIKATSDAITTIQSESEEFICMVKLGETFIPIEMSTFFEADFLGSINDSLFSSSNFIIADSVAPIVIRGHLLLKSQQQEEDNFNYMDTLLVYFSENVIPSTNNNPFLFIEEDGAPFTMELNIIGINQNVAKYEVLSIEDKQHIFFNDSLSVNPNAGVTDLFGIIQNKDNKLAPLFIERLPIDIVCHVLWKDREDEYSIDEVVNSRAYGNGINLSEGNIIVLDPQVPLVNISLEEISGSIIIYDVISNVVAESDNLFDDSHAFVQGALFHHEDRTKIAIVWNGKNRNDRIVGSGTYLGLITLNIPDYGLFTKKAMIPIGR